MKTNGRMRAERSSAAWALRLGLLAAAGAGIGAGACAGKFTSCSESETCEAPDSELPTDPRAQGGAGGAPSGPSCDKDPGSCSEHATCKTTDGVTSCVCDDGYEGDGETCEDIDECAEGDGPCDANATCTNTPGSFECTCNEGFFGTGTECWPLTDLVSAGEDGKELAGFATSGLDLSADGQVITYAMELDEGPLIANARPIFARDFRNGTNTLISVRNNGAMGGGEYPTISADGNLVLFSSVLGDLAGDDGLTPAVYLVDRTRATTQYVTRTTTEGGFYKSVLSADGRHVAFHSTSGGIEIKNLLTGVTTRADLNSDGEVADDFTFLDDLSSDGRYVAFVSYASNLGVPDNVQHQHVYVRDVLLGRTTLASVSSSSEPADASCYGPTLSGNGRFVAFESRATNLTPHEANGYYQVFVRDLVAGTTVLASVTSLGKPGNGHSYFPSLSHDGRFVAFASEATDLVVGDTNGDSDVFVRDLVEGVTVRVSVSSLGEQANASSGSPVISADGRVVAFTSRASNLAPGASGERRQVYRRVFRPE